MRRIFEFLKPYKTTVIIAPILKLLEAVFELMLPTLMVLIINNGIANNDKEYIIKIVLLMFALTIVGYVCSITSQYLAAKIAHRFGTDIRDALFEKVINFSKENIEKFGGVTLINRITNDTIQIQTGVSMFIRLVIRAPFLCIGSVVMGLMLNIELGFLVLLALPVFSIVLFLIMKRALPLYEKAQTKLDRLITIVSENLSGVRVIRAFSKVEHEEGRFSKANDDYKDNIIRAGRISALTGPMSFCLVNTLIAIILYFAADQVESGLIMNGEVVAFVNYVIQLMSNLMVISQLVLLYSRFFSSVKRVNAVFDTKPTLDLDSKEIDDKSDVAIKFSNVSFEYPDSNEDALHDINFTIYKGQNVGIIGSTGSGKSTIVKLIIRDYDATQGNIEIFGIDIKSIKPENLKRIISIAQQKARLFALSIRDNIKVGDPEATDEQIYKALDVAQASEFVNKFKDGLDHVLSRGSTNISGGQKQRLNIARAVVGNPEILILDDSSSALDYRTAQLLKRSIHEKMKGTTVINISQRISSVRYCDLIIVAKDGEINDLGKHDELLERCEEYREIYYSQYEDDDAK